MKLATEGAAYRPGLPVLAADRDIDQDADRYRYRIDVHQRTLMRHQGKIKQNQRVSVGHARTNGFNYASISTETTIQTHN
jgi:hypothetical protein